MAHAGEPPGGCLPGVFRYANPQNRTHVTEKPLQLMRDLVKICVPGGRILDPFCGAGTTVLAAKLEGYEAVGIEVTDATISWARTGCVSRWNPSRKPLNNLPAIHVDSRQRTQPQAAIHMDSLPDYLIERKHRYGKSLCLHLLGCRYGSPPFEAVLPESLRVGIRPHLP